MVGSEHAQSVGQQVGVGRSRARRVARDALPEGQVVPDGEHVGVVGAEDADEVVEEFAVGRDGSGRVLGRAAHPGAVAAGGEGVGVVRAEAVVQGGVQPLPAHPGRADHPGGDEVPAGLEEHGVALRLPEGLTRVSGQDVGGRP